MTPVRKSEPTPAVKQPEKQPVVVQQPLPATTTLPPPDPEAGLPPLSNFVKRALGSNKLRSRQDVKAVPSQLYSDLYRGPHGQEFRNRVNAILAR